MIKAAIFDMDGVLIGTARLWRKAYVEVLGRHGIVVTAEDIELLPSSIRTTDEVEWFHKRFGWQSPSKSEIANQLDSYVQERVVNNSQAMDGVHQVMTLLKAHNIPMAIASSSNPELIQTVIRHIGIKDHIKHVRSGEEEPIGKPHPGIYISAASMLAVEPANCLVFEDSVNGVKSAKAAGMKCIAVPEAKNKHNAEIQQADLVVNSLKDVTWEQIRKLWQ
jgi:sugar-phosphatase